MNAGVAALDILVNIDVPDLERGLAFYGSVFGLRVHRRFGTDGVELAGAAVPIFLLVKPEASAATPDGGPMRTYSRHWTPVHLDIVVADIGEAVARATAAGAVLERAPHAADWGKLALLVDPFGNGFCLIEFLGRGYDTIASA
jgi:predicted enzyme related to lactoylglutathione lyase